jgi:DNA (cytosine-5)-methyltransferase 1
LPTPTDFQKSVGVGKFRLNENIYRISVNCNFSQKNNSQIMDRSIIGIDLFSGAGGMSLGAIEAGIDVRFAVENDTSTCNTYSYNFKKTNIFSNDIRKLKEVPLNLSKKDEVILFGGPPCQGFSTSNQKNRNIQNDKNWLFEEFIRIIKIIKPLPKWVVFENVKGFSETESGLFLHRVITDLEKIGYRISYQKLNAVDFGIPQKRTRFFFVGSLDRNEIYFPKPNSLSSVSVKDALFDLPKLEVGAVENWQEYGTKPISLYAKALRGNLKRSANHQVTKNSSLVIERYKHIPQGGNWQDIPESLMS